MIAEPIAKLDLVNVNTADGDFGFIAGVDGSFVDITGKEWFGSTAIQMPSIEMSINGTAPSGEISMAYNQEPGGPDFSAQLRAIGSDYVAGRAISFYVQPLNELGEFYNPVLPVELYARRIMRGVSMSASGPTSRVITLSFETAWETRRRARRRAYNTEDHKDLIGSDNPSLEFIPTVDFQEEKLFG